MKLQHETIPYPTTDLSSTDDIDKLVKDLLNSGNTIQVEHDSELKKLGERDQESLKLHNTNYDNILDEYTTHVSKTLASKRSMKTIFFWISIITMIIVVIFVIVCTCAALIDVRAGNFLIQDYIVPAASVLTSFLTVFIVIPKIIAEYLFNSNEDSVMRDIVSNIQNYDKYLRDALHRIQDKDNDANHNQQ